MAAAGKTPKFFLDNNVPNFIATYLRSRGHSVYIQRAHIAEDAPDHIVAVTAMEMGRILITIDRDFKQQRFLKATYDRLHRVGLSGEPDTYLEAMKQSIDQIEMHWGKTVRLKGRLIAQVKLGQISLHTGPALAADIDALPKPKGGG